MRIALKCAYDGKPFHGFARQPKLKTVEGDIINLLVKQGYFSNPKDALFRSASRTDKGVSAFGNVISFNTEKKLNFLLADCNEQSENIIIYGVKIVDNSFYPRHAKQRIYHYHLKKNMLNYSELLSIFSLFIGTHDFSNFARIEPYKNPMKTIDDIKISETKDFFIICFYAQNFLWHQIRRIIATIQQIEQQKISKDDIIFSLHHQKKTVDYGLSSPSPLVLTDVIYDFSFEHSEKWQKEKRKLEKRIIQNIRCPS
jgi:tRNA pseudouridine38-40 synthase